MKTFRVALICLIATLSFGCKENFTGSLRLKEGPITLERKDGVKVEIKHDVDAEITLNNKAKNGNFQEELWISHQLFLFQVPKDLVDSKATHVSAGPAQTGQGLGFDADITRRLETGKRTLIEIRACNVTASCWTIIEVRTQDPRSGQSYGTYGWKFTYANSCPGHQNVEVERTSFEDRIKVKFRDDAHENLATFKGTDNQTSSDRDINQGFCGLNPRFADYYFKPNYQPTSMLDYRDI